MAITIDTCAAMHQGDRAEQQDRISIFPHPSRPGYLMAVLADGMGGHTGGAMAAEQVILKAKQNFATYAPSSEDPEEFMKTVIDDAHVIIKLTRFTSEQDPHSTAVVLMLHQGRADWAHCGDSRLYFFKKGKLVSMTRDHSFVNDLLDRGQITLEQAQIHTQRNLLLSCLGATEPPRIDCDSTSKLEEGDAFLLCSDGLWSYFSEEELGRTLNNLNARAAARILINAARERAQGFGDNISLAIIKAVSE